MVGTIVALLLLLLAALFGPAALGVPGAVPVHAILLVFLLWGGPDRPTVAWSVVLAVVVEALTGAPLGSLALPLVVFAVLLLGVRAVTPWKPFRSGDGWSAANVLIALCAAAAWHVLVFGGWFGWAALLGTAPDGFAHYAAAWFGVTMLTHATT